MNLQLLKAKKTFMVIITLAVFGVFVIVAAHKLNHASLWYDEVIEYWYSKILIGPLPYASGSTNMYQRITSTFQPPLYNALMHIWLSFGSSELWFRLFGVLIGFVGMIGIFKSICLATQSRVVACIAVLMCTFTYRLCYYWQECAEYCLMLSSLMWSIYFWIRLIINTSINNIVLFTAFAIIPVYSQYGAVFPVFGLLVSAFVYIMLQENRKIKIAVVISYLCALLFAALPLWFFFLRIQMDNQIVQDKSWVPSLFHLKASRNLLDFWNGLKEVFYWNFSDSFGDVNIPGFLVVLLLLMLFVLIKGKRTISKLLIWSSIISWSTYFLAVEIGLYSYGYFGNRYGLCFLPLWIVDIVVCVYELYLLVKDKNYNVATICLTGVVFGFLVIMCIQEWMFKIEPNWEKENNRGVVAAWTQEVLNNNLITLVYHSSGAGFSFYTKDLDNTEKVIYLDYTGETKEQAHSNISLLFNTDWPDEFYLAATHCFNDYYVLLDMFSEQGYNKKVIFGNYGQLIYLSKCL